MNQKRFAGIIIISIIIIILIIGGYFVLYKKPPFQILFPKDGDRLEIGDPYEISWENNSTNTPAVISVQTFAQDGQDLGYRSIATTSVPFSGEIIWTVPLMDSSYKYKVVVFDNQRQVIVKSDGFFTLKDEQFTIAGGENAIINPKNIFSFGTPFTITGVTGIIVSNETSSAIYASAPILQDDLVTARIVSFHSDACEVLGYRDASGCDFQGEQAVRIKILAVINSRGLHYTIQRDAYLTSIKRKIQEIMGGVEDARYKYEVELLSMDMQKQQATIIVRNISNNSTSTQAQ